MYIWFMTCSVKVTLNSQATAEQLSVCVIVYIGVCECTLICQTPFT